MYRELSNPSYNKPNFNPPAQRSASKFKPNELYETDRGIIKIIFVDTYETEQGNTYKIIYIDESNTNVDEFTEMSTYAKTLRKI